MDQAKTTAPAAATPEARLHFLDYWRVIRIRKAIIITVFLITAIIATAVTFILPETYASTVTLKVENDGGVTSGLGTPSATQSSYDPYFIQTTFELIKSQLVLSNVIASKNLNEVWGKKYFNGENLKTTETLEILKGRLGLAPIRNTKMITITVFGDDKNEAADLANSIAEAYRQYRVNTYLGQAKTGLEALSNEFKKYSDNIDSVKTNIEFLRSSLKILDQANSEQPTPTLDAEQLSKIHSMMMEDQKVYDKQKVQYDSLFAIYTNNPLALCDVLPAIYPDATLSDKQSKLSEALQKRGQLLVDYPPSNLQVVRTQTLIDQLQSEITNRIDGVMAGLRTQLGTTKASLDSLQLQVEAAKSNDFVNAVKFQPYYDEKKKLAQLMETHRLLNSKITAAKVDLSIPTTTMVQITDVAEPGKAPVKPNKTVNIVLGLVFGLIMGIGLAFFIEYLDTSVKTIDDVERTFQAPVLGVIPQNIGYLIEEGSESKHAEAYRVLRTNLLFSRQDEKLNTIVVVSAGAGEGKSTTTLNLSTVFAQAGNRVLIVDSDLRRPTLHKLFKVANNLGLTNYLLKQNTLAEIVQTTPVPGLDFMASGKLPNSSMGILGSAQMKEMITELRQRYDFIFFDSPPILGVSDASILASEVDLVVQVIQYRRYPQPMTIRAKQMIEKVGGNFVGIVLNNINMSQDEGYYYYSGYYHDYYYSRTPSEQQAEAKAAKDDEGETEFRTKA
jgi:capsular exopolysaccharide synthesis family protein